MVCSSRATRSAVCGPVSVQTAPYQSMIKSLQKVRVGFHRLLEPFERAFFLSVDSHSQTLDLYFACLFLFHFSKNSFLDYLTKVLVLDRLNNWSFTIDSLRSTVLETLAASRERAGRHPVPQPLHLLSPRMLSFLLCLRHSYTSLKALL